MYSAFLFCCSLLTVVSHLPVHRFGLGFTIGASHCVDKDINFMSHHAVLNYYRTFAIEAIFERVQRHQKYNSQE